MSEVPRRSRGQGRASLGQAAPSGLGRGTARLLQGRSTSSQAQGTIDRLMAAGTSRFGAHGYHRASIDQIVAEAAVSRGTFYKYFDDKLDLLQSLSAEAEAAFMAVITECPADPLAPSIGADLRAWLTLYTTLLQRHACVFRIWMEGNVPDATVLESGDRVGAAAMRVFTRLLSGVPRNYERRDTIAALMLIGLIERLPYVSTDNGAELRNADLVEQLALFAERALLNAGRTDRTR